MVVLRRVHHDFIVDILIKEKKKQTGDLSAEEYAKIDGAKTILGKYYEEIKNREQYG